MKHVTAIAVLVLIAALTAFAQPPKSLYESFEVSFTNGGTTPSGWTRTLVNGTTNWVRKGNPLTGQGLPKGAVADHKFFVAAFPATVAGASARLETPTFNFTGETKVRMNFRYVNVTGTDSLVIKTSTDGGSSWTAVRTLKKSTDTLGGAWQKIDVNLDAVAGASNVKIGFEAVADGGNSDIWLDRVIIQYPRVSIREIQEITTDSLLVADAIQRTNNNRWTIQRSWYFGDTLTVEGVVVTPAKVINFTAVGFNALLADTASPGFWGGALLRFNVSGTGSTAPDTALAIAWGVLNLQPGDYIRFVGYVDEFPATDLSSATQIVPKYTPACEILGSAPVPGYKKLTVSDFYSGSFPGGAIQFTKGEPYEFMRVELTGLTVVGVVNGTNGTFAMADGAGNQIASMDASKWFTTRGHRDPASTYTVPPTFARIDTIRGYILTNSGTEAARGFRIGPLYPGDIKIGALLPQISNHRRNPVVVAPDSTPVVSVRVITLPGGSGLKAANLLYSTNNGAFTSLPMTLSDTTYKATIPTQVAGTTVRYYITATDSANNVVKYASSALDGSALDTVKGFFFYKVLNTPITIKDIQTTPYPNGRTPYLGAVVSVSGIVTGDTTNMRSAPISTVGTNSWYIQSGTTPWSGLWVVGPDSILAKLRLGDSVTVTGTVQENTDVTRIQVTSTQAVVHATGRPLPSPVVLTTNSFSTGVGNGDASAEPYESMLVQFATVRVTNFNPTFADPTEYEVGSGDGSQPIIVRRDGKNSYSNVAADTVGNPGVKLIKQNDVISSLTGIVYYSTRRYNIVPRGNADYGTLTGVEIKRSEEVPNAFALEQNYPNPFNPTTTIIYALPTSSQVTLRIYNVLGQEVRTLVNTFQTTGRYTVSFDASSLPTGVYFYHLQAGAASQVKKMMLVK